MSDAGANAGLGQSAALSAGRLTWKGGLLMQVLMLDSDNLPLRNPEALFASGEYRRSGTLFFSDWWDLAEWVKPQAYTAFGLPYPGEERTLLAAESGQLLLNRRAHSLPNHSA